MRSLTAESLPAKAPSAKARVAKAQSATSRAAASPSTAARAAPWLWRPLRLAGWLGRAVLDVVYPPTCVRCRAATGEPHGLCARCWSGMPFITRPFCERLGTPFPIDHGVGMLSPTAIADPPAFRRARAASRYEGAARELLHDLKFNDRPELARLLGRLTAAAGQELFADADLIVPVPLHPLKLWSRRFNQAALLAATVAQISGLPADPMLLRRPRRTRSQVGLSRNERARNLQGAFAVPAHLRPRLDGRRVVLVDDVLTTGATVSAATRVLLRAGAAQVDVLTFARVVRDGT